MRKKGLSYLLIMLIALQSAMAMADVHQLHQDGVQHIEFDHDHGQNDNPEKSSAKNTTSQKPASTAFDCHHCCHCHGSHLHWLSIDSSIPNFALSGQTTFDYEPSKVEAPPTSLLRPPKA